MPSFEQLLLIAFAISLIWVAAMVDLLRRDDLDETEHSMWFAFLLVGNILAAVIYLVVRVGRKLLIRQ